MLRDDQPTPVQPTASASQTRKTVHVGLWITAAIIAFAARYMASFDDFWLDEIWSWTIAMQLRSPLDVITSVHHDNNHHLNTLVLYLCGPDASHPLYRLPAVVAGSGTVLLAAFVARRWSSLAAVTVSVVTGSSFLLIQYSSEARGYAYLLLFTIAAFAAIQKSFESSLTLWEALFTAFSILGFLSHPTYAVAYAALLSWSAWHRIATDGWLSKRHIAPLFFQVLVPCWFLSVLYYLDWRHLQIGGGDEGSTGWVFAQAISAAFGGPLEGSFVAFVAFAVLIVAVAALYELYRTGSDLWVPMLVAIFGMPAAVILILRPEWPYPRYFLVSMLFLQLLISWYVARLFERSHGKVAYLLIMAAIVGGNVHLTGKLFSMGRGGYAAAVNYLLEHNSSDQLVVASDHDFRNRMVLGYYLWRADPAARLKYVNEGQWPAEGPEWYLLHDFSQNFVPPESFHIAPSHRFQLAKTFPYFGLSGFNWALYRHTRPN